MNEKPPLAFISYDFNLNEADRIRFVEESAACSQPFKVEDWSAAPRYPLDDWKKTVHSRIIRCNLMVVLLSEGMAMSQVSTEIVEATRCNVPFFGVYTGTAPPALPDGLGANRTIPWDWARIASAVGQLSTEGKNHIFR